MKDTYRIDLDDALIKWLAARECFLSRKGEHALDQFHDCTARLFVAFAEDWVDPTDASITQAFCLFRKLAMQQADADRPERVRFHPCPVTPAMA